MYKLVRRIGYNQSLGDTLSKRTTYVTHSMVRPQYNCRFYDRAVDWNILLMNQIPN